MKRYILLIVSVMWIFTAAVFGQNNSKKETSNPKYPFAKGNLLADKENIKMNYLKNTEVRSDTIRIYNAWDKPMNISFKNLKPYMEVLTTNHTLAPKQEGIIILKFDGAKKMDFGYCYENLTLMTNDTLEPEKFFFVMVYIEEDFSQLTAEQRANGPRIEFETEKYEFGKRHEGEKIKYSFKFKNSGKTDLIIRKTKASCGCTASEPEKSVLKPGETSAINIVFDTKNMKGEQHKTVYVYSNDARYSTVALHITGEIE